MNERTHPGEVPGVDEGSPACEGPALRSDGGTTPEGGLFAAMPDPAARYVVGEQEARIVEVNAAYARSFDVDESTTGPLESRLRSDLERDPPGEGLARVDDIVELSRSAAADSHIRTVVRANTPGGERDYLARVVPLPDDDDADGCIVFTDITAQRERTRELIQQRDRLDEFASIVSHDLRNPLEVAKIQLEAAWNRGDDVHFEKVETAHDRMERIIEDVLTLARQGQVIDEIGEATLSIVVDDAWGSVSAPNSTVHVSEDAVLAADSDRLQELLENLFRNAVEHGSTSSEQAPDAVENGSTSSEQAPDVGEHAEPGVTVSVGLTDDGFYVADDGPGIPEEDRDRVFEGGFSTSSEGTGLGLVIVSRIADAHGWEVSVGESSEGGALFTFSDVEMRR
jgi:signal transduction histidine kinase